MSKQEFIEKLRMALNGQIPAGLVEENLQYYEEYINSQIRLGQTESMVMLSLGDPRLIAKSIITANKDGEYTSRNDNNVRQSTEENQYFDTDAQDTLKVIRVKGCLAAIVILCVFIFVIILTFSLLSLFLPVIVIGGIFYFLVKLFRDWLN